jgi:signal transduction histidine kinase
MNKQTILCVDDEIDNVEALERLFRNRYKVLKATSGEAALAILDQHPEPIALILTDQRMPTMTGVEFLEHSLRTHPEAVRILLTGYTDIESIIAAINSGQVYRYINKPWDPVDLSATVDRAVERFLMSQEIKQKNKELAAALAELQSLDQAKNQFMILINHELKTPLTSIISFSDLLKETSLNEEQAVCADRISKSAARLKELVDDSLLIVSAETKTLKLKPQPFESHQIDLTLKPEVEKIKSQRNIQVQARFLDKKIIGDSAAVSQVLRRLIHNGLKFAHEGSTIQIDSQLTQPHRIRLSVHNEGPPLSDSVREKILKPFYLDEDVMKHSTGVGLGLTVCQALLKAHASTLEFQNDSSGVTVSFELPCL